MNLDPSYETGNLPIALNSPTLHQGILYIGTAEGKMKAFDIESANLLWQGDDGGQYYGSPVVFNDQLLYGTTEGRLFSRHFLTGEKKYEVELGSPVESRPTVSEGRVFVHLRNHKIICLDVDTGKILWAYRRSVAYTTTIQRVSRPVVYDNKLYVGFADGYAVALSFEEGLLLWESKLAVGTKFIDADATPVFYKGNLVIGSLAGHVQILDPTSGRKIRELDYILARGPMILNDNLVLGTVDGRLVILDYLFKPIMEKKLSKGGISSIKKWQEFFVVSTTNGEILVVDQKSLEIVQRRHLGHSTSAVFGEIVTADNKLAFLTSRNRLYVYFNK